MQYTPYNYDYNSYTTEKFQPQAQLVSFEATEITDYHHHRHSTSKEEWADAVESVKTHHEEEGEQHEIQNKCQPPRHEKHAQRSILITGLSEGTTHADITAAVRGGLLLDIHLRTFEKAATVSFLHASSAQTFLQHSRRHDLYINSKRAGFFYLKLCAVL